MNCTACRGKLTSERGDVKFDVSGLPVILRGVETRVCAACGEREVVVPNIEGLHRLLTNILVRKPRGLAGREIRFLRKYLGWSGVDFAAQMGVTPETVSRWETGAQPISATADRLLRLQVVCRRPVSDYSPDALRDLGRKSAKPLRLDLQVRRGRWESAGVAE
ncbi:MAG: helix-turn-helix domain-containing protein [Myxococcota bacterium]|nr:helix-turn-helix domain-containing protein [Myxococcota bacterium]